MLYEIRFIFLGLFCWSISLNHLTEELWRRFKHFFISSVWFLQLRIKVFKLQLILAFEELRVVDQLARSELSPVVREVLDITDLIFEWLFARRLTFGQFAEYLVGFDFENISDRRGLQFGGVTERLTPGTPRTFTSKQNKHKLSTSEYWKVKIAGGKIRIRFPSKYVFGQSEVGNLILVCS